MLWMSTRSRTVQPTGPNGCSSTALSSKSSVMCGVKSRRPNASDRFARTRRRATAGAASIGRVQHPRPERTADLRGGHESSCYGQTRYQTALLATRRWPRTPFRSFAWTGHRAKTASHATALAASIDRETHERPSVSRPSDECASRSRRREASRQTTRHLGLYDWHQTTSWNRTNHELSVVVKRFWSPRPLSLRLAAADLAIIAAETPRTFAPGVRA
jgi:hypothetical protein